MVQLPDLFGRRGMERQLTEMAAKVDSATRSSEAADRAAQKAAARTQALCEAMRQEKAPKPEVTSAGPFVRVSWFAFCCFALASLVFTVVPAAFRDPAAAVSTYGSVTAAVEWHGGEVTRTSVETQQSIRIEAIYSQIHGGAEYVIWFPKRFAGSRYLIVLRGSAVLDGIAAGSSHVSVQSQTCTGNFLYAGPTLTPCEFLSGTIPTSVPEDVERCNSESSAIFGYVPVEVGGFIRNTDNLDWAHTITNLADLQTPTGPWLRDDFYNIQLPERYLTLRQNGCQRVEIEGAGSKLGDMSAQSTSSTPKDLVFDSSGPVAFVQTDRNAEGYGNGLIALGGLFLALSLGFVPVAYEEWGKWRRYRRA